MNAGTAKMVAERIASFTPEQFDSFVTNVRKIHEALNLKLQTEGTDELRQKAAKMQKDFEENVEKWKEDFKAKRNQNAAY